MKHLVVVLDPSEVVISAEGSTAVKRPKTLVTRGCPGLTAPVVAPAGTAGRCPA